MTAEEKKIFNYAYKESNIYDNKYKDLCGDSDRIHWSVKFGENVRIGFGTVIEGDCKVGDNTIVGHNCVIRPNTIIGENCMIGHGTVLEGDTVIGNRSVIHAQCHLTQGVTIEDEVWVGMMTVFTNVKNIVHGRKHMTLEYEYPIVRRGVRIGTSSKILPGVEIGENAFVGMGSLVTKDIPAKQLWVGSPAKYVRQVPENEWV